MILRGATVVILDDPIAGEKVMLAFNRDTACTMVVPLSNLEGCRQITIPDLRAYFSGPAMVVDPALSATILAELDKVVGQ